MVKQVDADFPSFFTKEKRQDEKGKKRNTSKRCEKLSSTAGNIDDSPAINHALEPSETGC